MQIFPHRDVDVGACLNVLGGLNFYKEYLFVFETFIFATLQILYSIFNSL